MADSKENSPTKTAGAEAPAFTDKEEKVLKVAWSCLKSGPPEIDLPKLQLAAGFNTLKTTANTWGVIKKKLATMTPAAEGGEAPGPATPIKATPKKRGGKKAADVSDEESPKKKQRKTPAKKAAVKAEEAEEAEGAKGEEGDSAAQFWCGHE